MDINSQIQKIIQENDVVLFMKGTPAMPMCGFSGMVCQVLQKLNVPFVSIDVMENQDMREGIKAFTQWPTIPQLYVQKEFVGGADIVKEMYTSGELLQLCDDKKLRKS